MICGLCTGAGSLLCTQPSFSGSIDPKTKKWVYDQVRREYYECPGCGSAGVRVMSGPPVLAIMHNLKNRKSRGAHGR